MRPGIPFGSLGLNPYSYLHPIEVAKTNFIGTLNVLMRAETWAWTDIYEF